MYEFVQQLATVCVVNPGGLVAGGRANQVTSATKAGKADWHLMPENVEQLT
eukprot:CAMPEP_0115719106 /NCGR_PEP_ID=MMETSP0272-20121206/77797_1 /TAXON_ID=71861 /ORGANISM="Scrippsiella trochoidea, Strain CCMP3099" /LENGTH=50 /DNA_ID=CAMNT_0003161699 /DNA_START=63 /DNA_END=215 /DNA_ORIENTATION=-